MAENVVKTKASTIQNDVDELVEKSKENRFQLNVAKCKELRISFAKHSVDLDPIIVNGQAINVAHTVKLLFLNISSELRWNCHVSEISRKFASRFYFLRQLKRANIPTKDLLTFYIVSDQWRSMPAQFFTMRSRHTCQQNRRNFRNAQCALFFLLCLIK